MPKSVSSQIVFIRHNFNPGTQEQLEKYQPEDTTKRLIAFDYAGEGYLENFNLYKKEEIQLGFKSTYDIFTHLQNNKNIIVCSEYPKKELQGKFFLGITNGHKIVNKDYKWKNNKTGLTEDCKLATLEINNVKKYLYSDYPVLLSSRPPHSTTCWRAPEVSVIFDAIYNQSKLKPEIRLISAV